MISVITPVYNGERFIESCIKDVIEQQCPDVEHIIVDGGSSDRTVEIIQQYTAQYSHIRWLSEPDHGQSDAMNKGLAIAQGDIIAILNVDDFYEPGVLKRVLENFQELPNPSFLAGNCNIWNTEGKLTGINRPTKLKFTDLLLGFHVNPFPMNPTAYFYHRSLHQQAGLYKVDDHHTMDLDFILRAVQVATVKYVNEIWGNYRMLEGTKTVADFEAGTGQHRVENLLKEYRKTLPFPHKIEVDFTYCIFKSLHTFRWFLIHRRDGVREILKELSVGLS
jgi:glycosyltransferase involved in cell wall biosynthesis